MYFQQIIYAFKIYLITHLTNYRPYFLKPLNLVLLSKPCKIQDNIKINIFCILYILENKFGKYLDGGIVGLAIFWKSYFVNHEFWKIKYLDFKSVGMQTKSIQYRHLAIYKAFVE